MAYRGLIHEKLDIKILILYILRRLPGVVDGDTLTELCQCDEGFTYFDYMECLCELIDAGNIEKVGDDGFRITEKGARSVDEVGNSIPNSVRKKAEALLAPVARSLERASMIKTSHERTRSGLTVDLAMSDGKGEVIRMRFLAGSENTAELIEKNFRAHAEEYFFKIVEMMTEKEDRKK